MGVIRIEMPVNSVLLSAARRHASGYFGVLTAPALLGNEVLSNAAAWFRVAMSQ